MKSLPLLLLLLVFTLVGCGGGGGGAEPNFVIRMGWPQKKADGIAASDSVSIRIIGADSEVGRVTINRPDEGIGTTIKELHLPYSGFVDLYVDGFSGTNLTGAATGNSSYADGPQVPGEFSFTLGK